MVGAAAGVPRRTLSNGHDSRTEDWEAMSQCARLLERDETCANGKYLSCECGPPRATGPPAHPNPCRGRGGVG